MSGTRKSHSGQLVPPSWDLGSHGIIFGQAVSVYGWLQPSEMHHGLGIAETTPGPLIQVVQFVGFLGAYRVAVAGGLGGLNPMVAGTLAAVLTT